jgi:hypothetical protein
MAKDGIAAAAAKYPLEVSTEHSMNKFWHLFVRDSQLEFATTN